MKGMMESLTVYPWSKHWSEPMSSAPDYPNRFSATPSSLLPEKPNLPRTYPRVHTRPLLYPQDRRWYRLSDSIGMRKRAPSLGMADTY